MDLDHDACYRAIELRDARFDGRFFTAVKTTGTYCRPVCPARTPRLGERDVLSHGGRGAGGGVPPVLAVPAGDGAGQGRLAGNVEHGVPRARAHRAGRPGRGERRRPGRPPGAGRAAAPAPVSPASRCVTDRGRSDPPRAARQAAHSRDVAADGRDRVRGGLRQHPPVQRDVPGAVRPCAVRAAAQGRTGDPGRSGGRDQPAPALSASLRLAGHAGVPAAPRRTRHRARERELLLANHRAGRPAGDGVRSTRTRGTRCARGSDSPSSPRCPASSRGCAASSTWPPIRSPSPRTSQRIRRWRPWWRRGRVCGCPARGTASSWRFARCWGSRSPSPPRSVLPGAWSPRTGSPWRSPITS